jgi:membrane protein
MAPSPVLEPWNRLVHFMHEGLWHLDPRAERGTRRILIRLLRVGFLVVRGLGQHQVSLRAMGLTYVTVFGLVPSLAVAFAMFKAFGGLDRAMDVLMPRILDYLAVGTRDAVEGQIQQFLANIHGGAIGGVGTVFVVVSVVSLLTNIERAFNNIWGMERDRPFLQRLATYWTMATVTPLLLGVGLTLPRTLERIQVVSWILERTAALDVLLSVIVPFLFVWVGFALLYSVLPNTWVSPGAAAIGGIAGGSLWTVAVWGYGIYAARAVQYSAIYGSLGAIPLFLVWLYLTWTIVLVGAEVAFAWENSETYGEELRAQAASQATLRLLALRMMCEVSQRFADSQPPPTASDLARALRAPLDLVRRVASYLEAPGLLHVTAPGTCFVPGRDPRLIHPADVLAALRDRGSAPIWPNADSGTRSLAERLAAADEAARAGWGQLSIKDLAELASLPA